MVDKHGRKKRRRKASVAERSEGPAQAKPNTQSGSQVVVADNPSPTWLRKGATGVALVYLLGLFFDGVQPKTTQKILPPTARYFTQATCLFPRAAAMAIDYRLEGWECSSQSFQELDPSPYFPIRPRDKESRFHRVAHFHRQNRPVMEALEQYVMRQENAAGPSKWGGIRVSSLRIPFPSPGETVERWQPPKMQEHPRDLTKHWFYTPVSRRETHCASLVMSPSPIMSSP